MNHLDDTALAADDLDAEAEAHLSRCPRCRAYRRMLHVQAPESEASSTLDAARAALVGAAEHTARVLEEGERVGPYPVVRWLRTRPGAVEYQARSPEGEPVWLQVLPRPVAPETLQALQRTQHPTLHPIVDFDAQQGRWVVREPVQGERLDRALEGASLGRWTTVLTQLAGCIAALHAQGLPHGHLDLQSVRTLPTGSVLVVDANGLGTTAPDWAAAPEAVLAQDWAALGTLMDQLLTPELRTRAPRELVELCARLQSSDPARRPAALEVLARLLAHHRPAEAHASRYEDLALLGRGGMGVVHCVRDPLLARRVALKALNRELVGPQRHSARFFTEAQITAQLEHPGIVPVHELSALPDGTPYFTMKEVVGRTLARVIRDSVDGLDDPWDRPRLVEAFRRVCEAVAYAHARGVVHRDLKPSNVMIGDFGEVLVVDWGLAAVYDPNVPAPVKTTQEQTHTGGGTPGYMPDEQRAGEAALDPTVDVYALGAVLWEILSGKPPLVPAELPPDTPGELLSIASRAMSHDPEQRYPNAAALCADIEAWQHRKLVSAHSYTLLERTQRLTRPYWPVIAGSAVGVMFMVTLGWLAQTARHQQQQVEAQGAAVLAEKAANALDDGDTLRAESFAAASIALRDKPEPRGILARVRRAWRPSLVFPAVALSRPCNDVLALGQGSYICVADDAVWRAGPAGRVWTAGGGANSAALADGRLALAGSPSRILRLEDGQVEQDALPTAVEVVATADGFVWRDELRAWREGPQGSSSTPALGERIVDMESCGDQVFLATERGIWTWTTGDTTVQLGYDARKPLAMDCTDTGDRLAVAHDQNISLWRTHPASEYARIKQHEGRVADLSWRPDGAQLASQSWDGSIRVWNASNYEELVRLPTEHAAGVLSYSPDGRELITADSSDLRAWALTGSAQRTAIDAMVPLVQAAWTGASEVAVIDRNGVLRTFDTNHGHRTGRLRLPGTALTSLASDPDGALVMGACDGTLRWGTDGAVADQLELATRCVTSVAAAATWVAAGTQDGEVVLVDGPSRTIVARHPVSKHSITQLSLDAHGGFAVLTSTGEVFWSTSPTQPPTLNPLGGVSVALAPDGETLALGLPNGRIDLVDRKARIRDRLVGHIDPPQALQFNADGSVLVSASRDRTVRVWDPTRSGEARVTLRGHDRGSNAVALQGHQLASVDSDGMLRLWSTPTDTPTEALDEVRSRFGARVVDQQVLFGATP